MPKVVHTDDKGLVQSAGSAVYLRSAKGLIKNQGAPVVLADDAAAQSASDYATGICTITPGAARTQNMASAASIISTLNLTSDNDSFDLSIINLSVANNFILAAPDGNVVLLGSPIVYARDDAADAVSSGSAQFRIRRTSSTAVAVIRLS
jgi:hypothetical protein